MAAPNGAKPRCKWNAASIWFSCSDGTTPIISSDKHRDESNAVCSTLSWLLLLDPASSSSTSSYFHPWFCSAASVCSHGDLSLTTVFSSTATANIFSRASISSASSAPASSASVAAAALFPSCSRAYQLTVFTIGEAISLSSRTSIICSTAAAVSISDPADVCAHIEQPATIYFTITSWYPVSVQLWTAIAVWSDFTLAISAAGARSTPTTTYPASLRAAAAAAAAAAATAPLSPGTVTTYLWPTPAAAWE
jgi:hypothetical protein